MFVLTTKHSIVDRGIAAVVAVAMVCWAVGAHYTAQAAGLTNITDVLSTSAPGVDADHTLTFTLPAAATTTEGVDENGDEIRITFPAGFDISAIVDGDIDVFNGGEDTLGTDWTSGVALQVLTLTSGGGRLANGDEIEIEIGTNATAGAPGSNQITNNAATGSYELLIEVYDTTTATVVSSNSTVLAIVDQVVVTADVDPIFEFYVTGTSSATTIDTEATAVTTSTTTIPFGTLAPGAAKVAAQELSVITNARTGFGVTVVTNQQLTASNNADIDSFADGADTASPTTWASPTGTIGTEDTYGHWGLRSSDGDIGTPFAAGFYEFVPVAGTDSPREIFSHNAPTNGYSSPIDEGYTQVLYKAEIMSFQEAADDYTATLTYVATPVF